MAKKKTEAYVTVPIILAPDVRAAMARIATLACTSVHLVVNVLLAAKIVAIEYEHHTRTAKAKRKKR